MQEMRMEETEMASLSSKATNVGPFVMAGISRKI